MTALPVDVRAHPAATRTLLLARNGLLGVLLLAELVVFGAAAPNFLTLDNLANVVVNCADLAVVAAGLTLVVLLAGIDVSVGAMVGIVAWATASLHGAGVPGLVVVAAAVGLGALLGAVNGGLVVGGRVPPIIATLGTAAVFKSVLFVLWANNDLFTEPVAALFGPQRAAGLPVVGLVVLAVFAVLAYVLRLRPFGRHLYAIGNDREGARLMGVHVTRATFGAYLAMGALVGLAALIYAGRVGVVQASAGNELTLPAIAAVVVGGTSILGGEGGVLRTLGGTLFIAVLQNGVVLMGVPPLWNGVLIGTSVALAATVDVVTRRVLDGRIGGPR